MEKDTQTQTWNDIAEHVPTQLREDVEAIARIHGPFVATFVRPETLFDTDSVYEATPVFLLTATHLIVVLPDVTHEFIPSGELITSTQIVPLRSITDYQVIRRRVLDGPQAGAISVVQLRMRWGASRALDMRPASCEDPTCEAEHGYVGMSINEDGDVLLDTTLDDATFARGLSFIDELLRRLATFA